MLEFFVCICMFFEAAAIPRGICKRGNNLIACQKIFVFKPEEQEFVSLYNYSFKELSRPEYVDMGTKSIRIVAHSMLPYITCDNQSDEVGGYVGDIWNTIQDRLQFRYTFNCTSYDEGRNITEKGDADVFLSASVAEEKMVNSYFSQPYFYNWYHLYLKEPNPYASSLPYLQTFSADLWLLMAFIFVFLTVTLWLNGKIINRTIKMEPNVSIPCCFLTATSGFTNQGHDLRLRSLSGRGQVLVALLFGVVIYSAMNAVLFSRLATSNLRFPFSSLDDIKHTNGLSLCLRRNSFVYENFTVGGTKDILPEWKDVLNNKNCLDIIDQCNIEKIVCKEGVVVFENTVIMSALAKRSAFSCQVTKFKTIYYPKGNTFVMSRALNEKRHIETIMMEMRSYGLLKRLENHHVKSDYFQSTGCHIWNKVTMGHVSGLLYLYAAAIILSLGLLVLEKLINRFG